MFDLYPSDFGFACQELFDELAEDLYFKPYFDLDADQKVHVLTLSLNATEVFDFY